MSNKPKSMDRKGKREENKLNELLYKKLTRREALSTTAKIGITAGVAAVVAGVGGYFGGLASVPAKEVIKTIKETVTQTVGAPQTVTQTITQVAQTIRETVTKTETLTVTAPVVPPVEKIVIKESVKLTLLTWYPSPETLTDVAKSLAEEYPMISVENKLLPFPEYYSTQATAFATGTPFDVHAQVVTFTIQYRDEMLPLNPLIEKYMPKGWENEYYPMVLDHNLLADPGKKIYYSLPVAWQQIGLAYNPKVFKENNVEVPKTWDELKVVADKFKKLGIDPIVVGSKDMWHTMDWFMLISTQFNYDPTYPDEVGWLAAEQGIIKWTDPRFLKTMEALQLLQKTVWQETPVPALA